MPLQNRVTPWGELIATPARGAWTGNRGCLHDDARQVRRQWVGRRWIICKLAFKGRQRQVMTPGRWTELFFLDEATALAAGHRPCFECRREDARAFAAAWRQANGGGADADAIDRILHAERRLSGDLPDAQAGPRRGGRGDESTMLHDSVAPAEAKRRAGVQRQGALAFPEGTMVERIGADGYWLIACGRLWRWTPFGYEHGERLVATPVRPLTPASTIAVLAAGYRSEMHPSALR